MTYERWVHVNPIKVKTLPSTARASAARAWRAYERWLHVNPIKGKTLTSFFGFMIGDYITQKKIEGQKEWDMKRTAIMGSFGLLWHGPSSHYFYGWLDRFMPGKCVRSVAAKTVFDQSFWNPTVKVIFFSYLSVAEFKGWDELCVKMNEGFMPAVLGSWVFWTPAHLVNFRFVPNDQRVLYINSLQILFNCFLSYLGNNDLKLHIKLPDVGVPGLLTNCGHDTLALLE